MSIQPTSYRAWPNNLRLANAHAELIVTLDVGPRILAYQTPGGTNVLKNYDEQMGGSGEAEWMIRGGHRLWVAPEGDISYALDNAPVAHQASGNTITVENLPVTPVHGGLRKTLTITLAEGSSEVTVQHRLTNDGSAPATVASWALSVMAPGGLEIIPVPALGEHPRDLLPNRLIVGWPYTDMADPRWRFGTQFITLRQTADGTPTKIGLAHRERWVGYLLGDTLFVKTFDYVEGAAYPDFGCNFETFSNGDMLEVESLGPLKTLQPGESTEHTEKWFLASGLTQPASLHEEDLAAWLAPILSRFGL